VLFAFKGEDGESKRFATHGSPKPQVAGKKSQAACTREKEIHNLLEDH